MEEVIPLAVYEPTANADPGVVDMKNNPPQGRRRSERLKKDTTLTTKEKNERMSKKRNLEGTYTTQNMFYVLPVDDIAELSINMGVDIDTNDFGTFDILKDLECARHDSYIKQKDYSQATQTKTVGAIITVRVPCLLIGYRRSPLIQRISSLSCLKRKLGRKKKLKISPNVQKKKMTQESPGRQTGRGGHKPNPPVDKGAKNRKK